MPGPVLGLLAEHVSQYVAEGPDALIFTGEKGAVLRRSNFNRAVNWRKAVAAIGAPGLHFHVLRHTGNMLAASTGASLRDLMNRMGHDSMRAALIYQHATEGADRKIADAIERLIGDQDIGGPEGNGDEPEDGGAGVVVPSS